MTDYPKSEFPDLRLHNPSRRIQMSTLRSTKRKQTAPLLKMKLVSGEGCVATAEAVEARPVSSDEPAIAVRYFSEPSGYDKRYIYEGFRAYVEDPGTYYIELSWSNILPQNTAYLRGVPMPPFSVYVGDFVSAGDGFFKPSPTYVHMPSARSLAAASVIKVQSASAAYRGERKYAPGATFSDCADVCPQMVVLPAGRFIMGSPSSEEGRDPDEGPAHPVSFPNPFAMGKYEVTVAEWNACAAEGECFEARGKEEREPMRDITWGEAQRYVEWLSKKTGQPYFLPSESEWEYAARAGTTTPWNTGDAIVADDENILNVFKRVVPVGSFPPNGFGLHDTHGNVLEWTQDCSSDGYFGRDGTGKPFRKAGCRSFILRGGYFASEPLRARSAFRLRGIYLGTPSLRAGLRVARAL